MAIQLLSGEPVVHMFWHMWCRIIHLIWLFLSVWLLRWVKEGGSRCPLQGVEEAGHTCLQDSKRGFSFGCRPGGHQCLRASCTKQLVLPIPGQFVATTPAIHLEGHPNEFRSQLPRTEGYSAINTNDQAVDPSLHLSLQCMRLFSYL